MHYFSDFSHYVVMIMDYFKDRIEFFTFIRQGFVKMLKISVFKTKRNKVTFLFLKIKQRKQEIKWCPLKIEPK